MSDQTLPHVHFEKRYAGEAPWDIPRPQTEIVAHAELLRGRVLDSGCGTGENALYAAQQGCTVLGVDVVPEAIHRAQRKANERGLEATFEVRDALSYGSWEGREAAFDTVIDSGVFHIFNDADRATYVAGLAHVMTSGATLLLICFSDAEPGTVGPRRVTRAELEQTFAKDFTILSITPTQYELLPRGEGEMFTAGGAKAYLLIARRR